MMKPFILAFAAVALVAACGGKSRSYQGGFGSYGQAALPFAAGPIQQACQASSRKAASRARCGCVQAVADQSLSASDQRRGAKYFKDPAALQDVRQSDKPGNERFWLAWKAYGQTAAAICAQT